MMLFEEAKEILKNHKKDLTKLGASRIAIFGSVARNETHPRSDVDILVDFDAEKGLFGFAGLKLYLEDILHCHVDLVSNRAIRPALREIICSEARQIF